MPVSRRLVRTRDRCMRVACRSWRGRLVFRLLRAQGLDTATTMITLTAMVTATGTDRAITVLKLTLHRKIGRRSRTIPARGLRADIATRPTPCSP